MTPRQAKRVQVPRPRGQDYFAVAESFFNGAQVAKDFEYWNAAGVLMVHAAIAYTDALTIQFGGVRSKGEDHMAAADLLRQVARLDEPDLLQVRHFERIINEKNRVSYEGEIFHRKDIEPLWKHLSRYREWACGKIHG